MKTMLAARLHEIGGPLLLEQIPIPEPRPTDVLVAVKACGVVPNLKNVLTKWPEWFPYLPLPKLPAIFGLDVAGVVSQVGSQVHSICAGDRVYVNPARGCGSCRACRSGEIVNCRSFTFQGYFGRGPLSQAIFDAYPYGGMSEYITAPQSALVKLPKNVSFEQAARFGYLGTAYSAIRKAGAGPGRSLLVNGIGGTLGLCAALVGLATGVTAILGTGRNQALLDRVKALAPSRIEVLAVGQRPVHEWAMELTEQEGVDAVIDTLPPGAPSSAMQDALNALRRGGRGVNIGGVGEPLPLNVHRIMGMNIQLIGSCWFTTGEGQELAEMARVGTLDLSVLEHRRIPLKNVNEGLASLQDANRGFNNYVVIP
jgi:D-arabinose 1-dehydrogenase-like Zn-dependent alcohol dehydrogenase